MKTQFHCVECDQDVTFEEEGHCGTGYGRNKDGGKVCYECCGKLDQASMIELGRAILYLSFHDEDPTLKASMVGNWPGTLSFHIFADRIGSHNIAGVRYDVWFQGPDGHVWWGVQYGDSTQICHCKRTKETCIPQEGLKEAA